MEVGADTEVGYAASEMVGAVAKINPDPFYFHPQTAGKTGEAAIVAHRKFAFQEVIVAESDPKPFLFAE